MVGCLDEGYKDEAANRRYFTKKWPTLPAGLLSDPEQFYHLLARLEAESDGRSPRGVYATPARFVDAVLNDELRNGRKQKKEPLATLSLSALPPSFRAIARQVNENIEGEDWIPSDGDFRIESTTNPVFQFHLRIQHAEQVYLLIEYLEYMQKECQVKNQKLKKKIQSSY